MRSTPLFILALSLFACTGKSKPVEEDSGEGASTGTEAGSESDSGAPADSVPNVDWIAQFEGDVAAVNELQRQGSELVIVGSFGEGPLSIDAFEVSGDPDRTGFVARLDRARGTPTALAAVGGSGFDSLRALTLGDDGSVVAQLGHFGTVEFAGATLPKLGGGERAHLVAWTPELEEDWALRFGGDAAMQLTPEGLQPAGADAWSVVGHFVAPLDFGEGDISGDAYSGFVGARVSRDGTVSDLWVAGGPTPLVRDGAPRANGSRLLAGEFAGSFDFAGVTTSLNDGCFLEIAADGSLIWSLAAPDTTGNTIAPASDGGAYVGGLFRSYTQLGGVTLGAQDLDGFYARLDADGTVLWARGLGNEYGSTVSELVETADGLWVTGTVRTPHYFGEVLEEGLGGDDLFIARIDPVEGEVLWGDIIGGATGEHAGIWADDEGSIYLSSTTQDLDYLEFQISPPLGEEHGFLAKFSMP